jgi:hypothetical protein
VNTEQLKSAVKERATAVAGSAAGTVADPGTGLRKIAKTLTRPGFLAALAASAGAYVLGRRHGRR